MTNERAIPRIVEGLSSLDDMLAQDGVLEEFQAVAIKEVLAWQLANAMKEQHMSRRRLPELMGTSRSQVSRLLDPKGGDVTLATLQWAAGVLGRKDRLNFA